MSQQRKLSRTAWAALAAGGTIIAAIPGPDLHPWTLGRRVPLEVYGAKGLKAMTQHLLDAYRVDIDTRTNRGAASGHDEALFRALRDRARSGRLLTAVSCERREIGLVHHQASR